MFNGNGTKQLLVAVHNVLDLQDLMDVRDGCYRVTKVADQQGALIALADRHFDALIWEPMGDQDDRAFLVRLDQLPCPVIVRTQLSRSSTRLLLPTCDHDVISKVSLRCWSSLRTDTLDVIGFGPSADAPILRTLVDRFPRHLRQVALAAAVCGAKRTRVDVFSRYCGMSARTLQWQLSRAGLSEARRLLGFVLTLHAVWRIDISNWSHKKAAAAAGFSSTTAFGNYISRHAGSRPTALSRSVGFDSLLAAFADTSGPGFTLQAQ